MATATALVARLENREADYRVQPHNIEAEQALLGALLVNNDVYDRVADIVQPAHFFDPVHARIFEVAAERIRRQRARDPGHAQGLLRGRRRPRASSAAPPTSPASPAATISLFAARDYAQPSTTSPSAAS